MTNETSSKTTSSTKENTRKEYVLGFLFSQNGDRVALIHKLKPDWQRGRLNGIGGSVEPGELPYFAMIREFMEETGIHFTNWKNRGTLTNEQQTYIVHLYSGFDDEVNKVTSKTEETVGIYDIPSCVFSKGRDIIEYQHKMFMNNVPYLIQAMLDPNTLQINTIHEI